jgi:hypothetical protein
MVPILAGRTSTGISHNITQERQVFFDEADFLYTAKDELFSTSASLEGAGERAASAVHHK